MAFVERDNRNRALGVAGAVAVNLAFLAALLTLGGQLPVQPAREAIEAIITTPLAPPPPPPPPPDDAEEGAAAPPSRGVDAAPSPPKIERPLPIPIPVKPSVDAGPAEASGLGSAAGSGAGLGGEGNGSGAGDGGAGRGAARVTPPMQVAGALTNADYRNSGAPRGAAGMVVVSFRVRSDGGVDQCAILDVDGYLGFGNLTCRLIEQRFRFRPAMDAAGRAIDWTIRTDYTWVPR